MEAEAAYAAALTTDLGRRPTPDDPLWHQAIEAATAAVNDSKAAGGQTYLDALALSARVHGSANWYSRAVAAWDDYLAAGGTLSDDSNPPAGLPLGVVFPTDSEFLSSAVTQLAYSRQQAGDVRGAREQYMRLLEFEPDSPEARRRLGSLALGAGELEAAEEQYARLVELNPHDANAAYFLELVRERLEFGLEASDAFRAGIRAYEDGELELALDEFVNALEVNPAFGPAVVWAARSAFELGRPEVAETYWRLALEADPSDSRSRWFLEVTREQLRYGVAAANAFYAGQSSYGLGEITEAREQFVRAAEENRSYTDAWVWAARTSQEAGEPAAAISYWYEVLRLNPSDARARWFLQAARQQLRFGTEAGTYYTRGFAAFQSGDVEGARESLEAAVEVAPEFTAAWSQLAQALFQAGDYEGAEGAYLRALELDPTNEDYEFFAGEARRLAEAQSSPE